MKAGDIIEVKDDENKEWTTREFICMSSYEAYLCWTKTKDKRSAYSWKLGREIPTEPEYYYQYELKDNGDIYTTNWVTDEVAERLNYTEKEGYYKIISSKRLWEHKDV